MGFIVESFGGNTTAGADFLREAVRRMDISGREEGGGGQEEGKVGETGSAEGLDGQGSGGVGAGDAAEYDIDGVGNTKRVAETDLEDVPRAKAARTGFLGEGLAEGEPMFIGDMVDDSPLTIVLLVRRPGPDRREVVGVGADGGVLVGWRARCRTRRP